MVDVSNSSRPSGVAGGVDVLDLAPSEEIREFARSAREEFASLFPIGDARALIDGAERALDHWDQLVAQGYLAVGLPEDAGGFGTLADLSHVLEECGRAILPVPLTMTIAAAQTLVQLGAELDEVSLPAGIALDDGGPLVVIDGELAAEVVVLRETADGVLATRIDVVGVERERATDVVDPGRASAVFERGAGTPVNEFTMAIDVDTALAPARFCLAADLVGTAGRALDESIAHVLVRRQFGQVIGSFQAVKHVLADCYVGIERARSLVVGAAAAIASGDRALSAHLSMLAKATAGDAALRATGLQVQLLGAMGLTWEADSHILVRRVQQTARAFGTPGALFARAASKAVNG